MSLILPALLARRATEAQLRLGAEFQVNSHTTSNQSYPAIAADSAGNFVVVWNSLFQDGSDNGIFGQRYASSGMPLGAEFQVNSYTTNLQTSAAIAADPAGNFVVVWISPDGSNDGVFGQRYASSGARLGAEFQVNSYTTNFQVNPAVASDSAGNFVVVWNSKYQDGSIYPVFGQRYASSGTRLGAEFQVNSYTTNLLQRAPTIAAGSAGNFVVVWSRPDGFLYGVFGQRYASSGARLGTEFPVNSYTTNYQVMPTVASDPAGNFVVVWQSNGQDGSFYGVFGQRYASSGARLGTEFLVTSYTTNYQRAPAIASDPAGNFVVVWQSKLQDGLNYGVFGQRYGSSGAPLGTEFQVNSYTTSDQNRPKVVFDSAGNFVVVWQSKLQDGSSYGIFGQRFCTQPLTAVSVSTSGSLSVCSTSTGGMATVTDSGGATNLHQWFYRTSVMGAATPISGQTGITYVINGTDFAGGAAGFYYLGCFTTPTCGSQTFSSETIIITVSTDATPPSVTPPSSLTTTQSLCQ